ncbi:Uncharacterised protein [Mycobacteroides abscessus]|nr:Uncharacterised protein [Mycobacteroides abscessus]
MIGFAGSLFERREPFPGVGYGVHTPALRHGDIVFPIVDDCPIKGRPTAEVVVQRAGRHTNPAADGGRGQRGLAADREQFEGGSEVVVARDLLGHVRTIDESTDLRKGPFKR